MTIRFDVDLVTTEPDFGVNFDVMDASMRVFLYSDGTLKDTELMFELFDPLVASKSTLLVPGCLALACVEIPFICADARE
ncbi:hypothetical protein EAH85_09465 [Curtobacterium flaccumfaciens]|nr:hypothetical protein EAH85_09465 [Curtobacterium flaccumfaciens]